jgi:adenylate kinase
MRLIFIGPPGSGKGTQAKLLCKHLGLVHIATGDILREAVEKETPEGVRAEPYMSNGKLVPDDIVNEIVNARFCGKDKPVKFVMDGYPRTLAQALSFDTMLREQALPLNAVIFLGVEDEEIVRRISGRLTCINPECGAVYHAQYKPPRITGRCDLCNHLLFTREDDRAETVRQRLQVFHASHDEILQHYRRQGLLVEVPGRGDIDAIYAAIVEALKQKLSS